jgi:low affinity Fe/Cu permease
MIRRYVAKLAIWITDAVERPESLTFAFLVFFAWISFAVVDHLGQTSSNVGSNVSGWVPFIMVFALSYTQRRNSLALHAKLDVIIKAQADADNRFIGIEKKEDHEIQSLHGEVCDPP